MGLTLSRRVTQKIRIGPDIVIVVSKIGRQAVRLTIEAPRDLLIIRDESELCSEADGDIPITGGASRA